MDCNDFGLKIDAYVDGALAASEREAMDLHRSDCRRCYAAFDQANNLGALLRAALPALAQVTSSEQVALRENVLRQLGAPPAPSPGRHRWGWLRLAGLATALVLALAALLILYPGGQGSVSAAAIVDRAWLTAKEHQGMKGVLHWQAEFSQRIPSGLALTRTFEIWFDFDDPGRYRITQYDPNGYAVNQMVRDGVDHMWQISRTVSADGSERVRVDEIILSPDEMAELTSWYVPSPFLDDLDRFADVLSQVEVLGETHIDGRPAYILNAQLFGFGWPAPEGGLDPVTSTVQLVVDAETYWLLGRTEQIPQAKGGELTAGFSQRTQRFEIVPPGQIPPDVFDFRPPGAAEVHTVQGLAGYYAPKPGSVGLQQAADLTSFSLVLPSELPADLQPRPSFRYQGAGKAGVFGMVYLGRPGRQAFLLEYAGLRLPARAARLIAIGDEQGWLVADPIDGQRFTLYLLEPQPQRAADGRLWPRSVELQVWGLSLNEAAAMLASLEPY